MRWILVCFGMLGCAGVATKPARIAHSCPNLPARGALSRAYIELASVRKRDLPRSLAKLKQQPIDVQQVTGLVAEDQSPVALDWDRCLDSKCELKLSRTLLVTGYLPERVGEPVRIEVMIREGVGEHASVYIERVETRDQQPVAFDEHGDRSLMVATPYLIAGDNDLQQLIACKKP
ncbi:MAG TPA: hypothetical protein VFX59_15755 [Polyangiales bacterium]|nr:hypothetical protein [Polyangiales bacterium]